MQKLARYLKRSGLTASQFSKKLKVTRPTITRLLNEADTTVSAGLAVAIEKATGGAITVEDFAKRQKRRKRPGPKPRRRVQTITFKEIGEARSRPRKKKISRNRRAFPVAAAATG